MKLLDRIPLWKRLGKLPAEVEALEKRVAALEEALKQRPAAENCPLCQVGVLRVTSVRPHPTLGMVGVQQRALKCDAPACGHTEDRVHDPNGRMGPKK